MNSQHVVAVVIAPGRKQLRDVRGGQQKPVVNFQIKQQQTSIEVAAWGKNADAVDNAAVGDVFSLQAVLATPGQRGMQLQTYDCSVITKLQGDAARDI